MEVSKVGCRWSLSLCWLAASSRRARRAGAECRRRRPGQAESPLGFLVLDRTQPRAGAESSSLLQPSLPPFLIIMSSALPTQLVPEDHANLALALEMAQRSLKTGGIPIGAVLYVLASLAGCSCPPDARTTPRTDELEGVTLASDGPFQGTSFCLS